MSRKSETEIILPEPCRLTGSLIGGFTARKLAALLASVVAAGMAELTAAGPSWQYRLTHGSELVDDCQLCGRPTISLPLSGQFTLVLVDETPLSSRYELRDVQFHTGTGSASDYRLTGSGTFEVGGEVALRQEVRLELQVASNAGTSDGYFTNEVQTVTRAWPMMAVSLNDANGTLLQTYRLVLNAAPLREIWFSTSSGLTSGNSGTPFARRSSGDVLSSEGQVVRANADLLSHLGLMPPTPEVGIDAIEVRAGGEIWFSLGASQFSETLGLLGDGDLLSETGRVIKRNHDLIAAFRFDGDPPDLGLDAVHVLPDGEMWFSTRLPARSEALGMTIGSGDLLSDRGHVVRLGKDLLARFEPSTPEAEIGLDAIHVWPTGEIWFSVESGFVSGTVGGVHSGDVLSDQGFIVVRNLDLVQPFAPLEDLADFGLDGLWLVADASPPVAPGAKLAMPHGTPNGGMELQWTGPGRVYQVERAWDPGGPYAAASPILAATSWQDPVGTGGIRCFYRVRQW